MTGGLRNTRALVTGVSGFIGSHLARRLVREDAEVHGLARADSNLWRLEDIKDEIIIHHSDIRDFTTTRTIVAAIKPQKIFHLAAYVDTTRSPEVINEMVEVNLRGTLNLLRALNWINYDCFINTGASEEYGDNPAPFREDQIPNPSSPYSASKVSATAFCQTLHKTHGAPIITLRPFLTYGPGQEGNMLIPSLIKKTIMNEEFEMTKGEQTREFNYVDDIVDAYIRASIIPRAIGEIINIGNGLEYKVIGVVKMVLRLMESSLKPRVGALDYRHGEAWHFFCDNTKAKEILGWQPAVNLEDGLKNTINWSRIHYKNSIKSSN
ncbi:MAG: SDR family NAD(P)-dependent oxidoreductase [Dehalococcoidia bacterium]|nr:SDR family NAD(P)-dependent oxidoreductase [Dehalococcoidia bacterium]